tara:strand:+ start:2867 stop:3610 length:744 start_codon:yes stop_codon:yes gene_type:complete
MNILMTGMQGFIGTHLKNRLFLKGNNITGYDTKIGKDISDFKLTEDTDLVIHLAAFADVRASIKNPNKYWKNNVNYTTKIQKECHRKSVPLLYASSSCVHAWHKSPYGISKKVNEETALERQVGLRFTTVYGDGARDTMMIGKLVRNEALYCTKHVRDFIHVDDVCDVIELIMETPMTLRKPAYDIGTGKGYRIDYLANDVCGYSLPVHEGDDCEAADNTADITYLKSLGWSGAKVNVVDYLKEKVA